MRKPNENTVFFSERSRSMEAISALLWLERCKFNWKSPVELFNCAWLLSYHFRICLQHWWSSSQFVLAFLAIRGWILGWSQILYCEPISFHQGLIYTVMHVGPKTWRFWGRLFAWRMVPPQRYWYQIDTVNFKKGDKCTELNGSSAKEAHLWSCSLVSTYSPRNKNSMTWYSPIPTVQYLLMSFHCIHLLSAHFNHHMIILSNTYMRLTYIIHFHIVMSFWTFFLQLSSINCQPVRFITESEQAV